MNFQIQKLFITFSSEKLLDFLQFLHSKHFVNKY